MSEFPVFVYRRDNEAAMRVPTIGGVAAMAVHDADERKAALAEGWAASVEDLKAPAEPAIDETSPPTRAELVQKAKELGLTFHHKTGDAKLAAMIEEALA
jgi:hypothetical protein